MTLLLTIQMKDSQSYIIGVHYCEQRLVASPYSVTAQS
jgi:hypothetical protein